MRTRGGAGSRARHSSGGSGGRRGAAAGTGGSGGREEGARRGEEGLAARGHVHQGPEPRESPPICPDLTWLPAAAAAPRSRSTGARGAPRSAGGSAARTRPGPRCAPEPAGGAEQGGPGGRAPSPSAPRGRATMSFPQLGYQYIRPIYPPERPGTGGGGGSAGARGGPAAGASELAASGSLSNVLSSVYGAPYAAAAAAAAAAQGYGAFLPYAAELPLFPQLVSARGSREWGWGWGGVGGAGWSWATRRAERARVDAQGPGQEGVGGHGQGSTARVPSSSPCAFRAHSTS